MYMTGLLHHLRAIRRWSLRNAAQGSIDVGSLQMSIRVGDRQRTLHPRFRTRVEGRQVNSEVLSEQVTGFVGWLPYQPVRWSLSSEKLAFKVWAKTRGLRTPRWWPVPSAPEAAFVVKRSLGAFGLDAHGPYRVGEPAPPKSMAGRAAGRDDFAEQFIQGINLKLWVWGTTIFHAHASAYASVVGDGRSTIEELRDRLAATQVPRVPRSVDDDACMDDALAFQGHARADVLADGESVWLDFRYGRDYRSPSMTADTDNALPEVPADVMAQSQEAVDAISAELAASFPAPLLYSLDGVLDPTGHVWWLGVNANPSLPPTGYAQVFSSLFETAAR